MNQHSDMGFDVRQMSLVNRRNVMVGDVELRPIFFRKAVIIITPDCRKTLSG
jgi:hypothetical protein